MKKVLGGAVLALMLVGCGGPLEDDGTDATGAKQQALDIPAPPPPKTAGPELRSDLLRTRQDDLVGIKAFQERQHLSDPIRGGDCGH